MKDVPPNLSSANWKLDRAVELLSEIDSEVIAWHNLKPYSYYTYINPEKTRASVIVREHHAPPVIRWSLIVADIVHNLRCALDHAFWAVLQSEYPVGFPKGAERLSFPIWDSSPTAKQRDNFRPVGNKILAAVETVQPFNNPCTSTDFPIHPLVILRDIDNGNKHKLLFTVIPSVGKFSVKVSNLRQAHKGGVHEELYRGELKNDVEAVVTTFPIPEPYVEYECTQFMSIIAIKYPISNSLGQDRDDYAALIDALIVEVRKTISDFVMASA